MAALPLSPLLAAALLLAPPPSRAASDPAYADTLVAAARAAGLAHAEPWLRLGHWRRTLGGGWESEADGPAFFLTPRGKTDPEAELEATLRAFFEPAVEGDASTATALEEPEPVAPTLPQFPTARLHQKPPDSLADARNPELPGEQPEHPQCRFPARLAYLAGALRIDPARLPLQPCQRFEAFWRRLAPRSVALVFSAYYLNNPASAFGHTFLRIGKEPLSSTAERFDLIDQGVDYAAGVDTGNALLYAIKGFTGMFRGGFSARPYFYKVREYADFESRDLWQYELDLAPGEIALLVAHLWELGHTWFDYYYLTENCSYHVLGALEAAAPRLHLLDHLGTIVLPADSVKALFSNPGLVRRVSFRPSARTLFEARARGLDAAALDAVEALADGREPPGFDARSEDERIAVLDAAADLIDVRHGRAMVEGSAPEMDERRTALLDRRAAIRVPSPPLEVPPPAGGGPEYGHGPHRLALSAGGSTRDGALVALDYRIALHGLLDPARGYPSRTGLEFLKGRLTYAAEHNHLRLDEAWLVDATSLNLFDRFERKISWKLRAGLARIGDAGCDGCVAGRVEVGGGPALVTAGGRLTAALTTDGELAVGPLHGLGGSAFRPGVGPGVLLRALAGERLAVLLSGTWRWLPGAAPDTTFALGAEARVQLGPVSLGAELRRTPLATEGLGSIALYSGP